MEAPTAKRHLVVLDVNGILLERYLPKSRDPKPLEQPSATTPRGQILYNRPYMQEAIELLCKSFSVLVWSSMMGHNLKEIVDQCFQDKQDSLLGIWDQSHCTEIKERDLEPGFRERYGIKPNKPIFLKELSKLQEYSNLRKFYPDNVLLIDDSVYKAIRNPDHTAIHPEVFCLQISQETGVKKDVELELICKYLKRMLRAPTVTSFVLDNPFPLWKAFRDRVLHEKEVTKSGSWCVRRSGQAEALANIWEQELLKAQDSRKEHLLAVMTMAVKIARSPDLSETLNTGSGGAAAAAVIQAIWIRLPRAVRHTLRHCKPGLGQQELMKSTVDTFNVTFDPRSLLGTRPGESLGPLWREVELAAKTNSLLPGLTIVKKLWQEASGDAAHFGQQMSNARRAAERLEGGALPERPSKAQHI